MQDFRGLKVWQKGHQLALAVYKATLPFPKQELYGLTNQMRRCSVSVPANVAEGCGRDADADFARFLRIAMGSANELEYYIVLSRDLGFLDGRCSEQLANDVAEVKRMLNSFIQTLKANRPRPKPRDENPGANS